MLRRLLLLLLLPATPQPPILLLPSILQSAVCFEGSFAFEVSA